MTKGNGSQNNRESKEESTLSRYDLLEQEISEELALLGVETVKRSEHPEWFPKETTGAIFVPRMPRRRPSPFEEESATG